MGFLILFLIPSMVGAVVFALAPRLLARLSGKTRAIILAVVGLDAAAAFFFLRDPGLSLMRDGGTVMLLALIAGVGSGAIGALIAMRAPVWLGLAVALLLPLPMWF